MTGKGDPAKRGEVCRDLSPRQVAEAIGVSVSSLKRWCDRGDLPTTKTSGGHRRIPRSAVVRFLRDRGYHVKQPDLLGLPAGSRLEARDRSEVLPQLITALQEGDEMTLANLLTGLYLARRGFAEIADDYLRPAFAEIGSQWQRGDLDVFEEHRAVSLTQRVLVGLRSFLIAPRRSAPLVIAASLSEDPYTLPITMIELSMREQGWNSAVIGPNTPASTLCRAVDKLEARMLCISISYVADSERTAAEVAALSASAEKGGVALVVGGNCLSDSLRARLEATAFCSSMGELTNLARALEPDLRWAQGL